MTTGIREIMRGVNERGRLMKEINGDITMLNENFENNPMQLSGKTINNLITNLNNLMEIDSNLYAKREDFEHYDNKWWKYVSPISITTTFLQAISWVALTALGIWSISSRNKKNCNDLAKDISTIVISSFGVFLTSVLAYSIKSIDEDRDKYQLLSQIQKIDYNGERRFLKFLKTFEEFKKRQVEQTDSQTREKFLKKCVVSMKKMPKSGYREKLLPQDQLILAMLQMLPEKDPIRIKYEQLKKNAMQILNVEEESDNLSANSLSEDDSEEREDTTPLSSSSDLSQNRFEGEQLTLTGAKRNIERSKVEETASDQQELSPKEIFAKYWKELEDTLNTKINTLELENYMINRNCEIVAKKKLPKIKESYSDSYAINIDYVVV